MKKILYFSLLVVIYSCSSGATTEAPAGDHDAAFQALLPESLESGYDQFKGVSMSVYAPELNINWSGAEGYRDAEKENELSADNPFRIASMTKTFVAAAILRLHEMDSLSVHSSISKHISAVHDSILREGGYDTDAITIQQCLSHTSGIYDYAMAGNTYVELVRNNPQKVWTRTEQLQIAMDTGKPVGKPGERYRYGDTGYILLGEIIEHKTGMNLGKALRSLLKYEALGLRLTWLEAIEEKPEKSLPYVSRYFRGIDATEWHPSMDLYGGGGLVSTSTDLAIFLQSLFSGKVFDKKETLDMMIAPVVYATSYNPQKDPSHKDYRSGVWQVPLYGMDAYMHKGVWGSTFIVIPELKASIATNYTRGNAERMIKKAALIVKNVHDKKVDL